MTLYKNELKHLLKWILVDIIDNPYIKTNWKNGGARYELPTCVLN